MSSRGRPRGGRLPVERSHSFRPCVYFCYERGDQWNHNPDYELFDLEPRFQTGHGPRYLNSNVVVDIKTGYWKRCSRRDVCRQIASLGNQYEKCLTQLDGPDGWPDDLMQKMKDIRAKLFLLGWSPHLVDEGVASARGGAEKKSMSGKSE